MDVQHRQKRKTPDIPEIDDDAKRRRLFEEKPKRKSPDIPEFEDEAKRRRINLSEIKRKRLPNGTLIGLQEDASRIMAMGIPTRKNKFIHFKVEEDGNITKVGTVTEQTFTESHRAVYRTNKPTTLATDGTIDPDRLTNNISIVKAPKEKEEETLAIEDKSMEEEGGKPLAIEDKSMEEEGEPLAIKDKTTGEEEKGEELLTDKTTEEEEKKEEKKETATVRQEDKQNVVAQDVQEQIVDMSHAAHPSAGPVGEGNPYSKSNALKRLIDFYQSRLGEPEAATKFLEYTTELDALENERTRKPVEVDTESMSKSVNKEVDEFLEQINSNVDKSMPEKLKKIEKDDMEVDKMEKKIIKDRTKKDNESFAIANESSDALLSKGEASNARITDISTGHHINMEIEDQLNNEDTDVNKGAVVEAKNRKDLPGPMDVDKHMFNANSLEQITLGADAQTDRIDLPSMHSSSNTTSANKMQATVGPMEGVEIPIEAQQEKERKKQLGQEIGIASKQFKEKRDVLGKFDTRTEKRTEQMMKKGKAEGEQQRKSMLELMQSGGDIQGFDEMMKRLAGQDIVKDPENVQMRKRVLAILRKDNKMMDIRTAAAPTEQDILAASVKEQSGTLGTGQRGGSGIGTPIFAPDTSRSDLYELQKGVATLTEIEALETREELTPLWNEFKLGRIAAGVREMERMPTRLITSDKSSLKVASRIRADMKQEEDSFGYFMYWLLHDRLDPTRETTWRAFLTYSAALGYNDLSQTQINWMITGHENGNLDSNTNFSTVESEEGDPLDVLLDIKGQKLTRGTIKALAAQVIGNPEPQAQYPSRNTSPSAAPVDNSIHPDGSTGVQRQNRRTFEGVPSFVMNIPDPRFSRRGGIDVPNVRLVTRRNPEFDPKLKPEDKEYKPEFITEEVPDIGVGSKDIGAHINQAQSDRLLRSIPTKLYAPIHPQACDRYFGTLNYQRLSLPIEKYMKAYSQHPWGPTDFQQMYNWNLYTMALYGGMLYAFVNDINMQKTTPIFDMGTPEMVGDEYMELNELINELARFQQNADDRADRVADSGAASRPLEEQLDKFHQDQSILDKEKLFQGDVAIISTEGLTPFPSGGGGGSSGIPDTPDTPSGGGSSSNPWGPGPDPRMNPDLPWAPDNDRREDEDKPMTPDNVLDPDDPGTPYPPRQPRLDSNVYTSFASQLKPPTQIGASVMDRGITNRTLLTQPIDKDVEMDRKVKMYKMFFGR